MEGKHDDFDQFFNLDQASEAEGLIKKDQEAAGNDQGAVSSLLIQHESVSDGDFLQATSICFPLEESWTTPVASEIAAFVPDLFNLDDEFSTWIPRYSKPAHPCEHCRSRQLECFLTFEGQTACSPCSALFRECSFTNPGAHAPSGAYLDTLHAVSEDAAQDLGALTNTRPLFSLGASMNEILDDIIERRPDRDGIGRRFSRTTVQILMNWLDAHGDHPYPTDEEKEELKEETGLTRGQISSWLANARRRGKVRPKRTQSPSVNGLKLSQPIDIPRAPQDTLLTPMERWRASPPENEPASVTAIACAVATSRYHVTGSGSSSQSQSILELHHRSSSTGSAISGFRAPSTTSLETGGSSDSVGSYGSVWSHGSRNSFHSLARKDRRRRRHPVLSARTESAAKQSRPFQCTFCTDTFQNKYDWTRHEKSLHLSLEKWICAPWGPTLTCNATERATVDTQCVYCQSLNPSREHIELHNHALCEEKGIDARTFYRKDHLRQHLRLVHTVTLHPSMNAWKSASTFVRSRCGFCASQTFTTWPDRADHLTKHFREGSQMSQWQGDLGFDPEVAATITNSMPMYLTRPDAKTCDPFRVSQDESAQSHPTSWEVLTAQLGHFVEEQQLLGVVMTDEMLQ